ncbi:MAG: hypothetical protein Q9195_005896 [Heterodermia aff. obscurata]
MADYVGTLHEISSENSTVALENVVSFGTEDRRPDEVVPASDNVYEYIVFRGSDVKDLRIEEAAPPKENKPPQVPDDPAILGSIRRPESSSTQAQAKVPQPQKQVSSQEPPQAQPTQQPQNSNSQQQKQTPVHNFQPPPPFSYPPYGPPPNQRFGPYGFPPGPGYPGMQYGAPPPAWGYSPSTQGFPHPPPRQFYPPQMPPIGSGGPQQTQSGPPAQPTPPPAIIDKEVSERSQAFTSDKPVATVKLPSATATPAPVINPPTAPPPPPPTESKPDVAAALAPPGVMAWQGVKNSAVQVPTATKSGRIMPAIPLKSPAMKPATLAVNGISRPETNDAAPPAQAAAKSAPVRPPITAKKSLDTANQEAAAAVAAAMAKLPPAPGQKQQPNGDKAIDNLAKKVNEMRTIDNNRNSKQSSTGGYAGNHRGGRGGARGGRATNEPSKKIEVPATDYDFTTANAKFNKQDLVKEAIASGSPIEASTSGTDLPNGSSVNGSRKNSESVIIPPAPGYNKTSSFFDNISSETKDRLEGGGREFRTEEQKRNVETFGQGSIDNGYRGGYRGRSRGRGFGRGRGGYAGRGGYGGRGGGARSGRGVPVTDM